MHHPTSTLCSIVGSPRLSEQLVSVVLHNYIQNTVWNSEGNVHVAHVHSVADHEHALPRNDDSFYHENKF